MGVVTGIPLEFQFGTNWARFSNFAGEVDRPDPGDGGGIRVLPRIDLSRIVSLRGETSGPQRSPRGRGRPVPRFVAFRAISSSSPTPSCNTRSDIRMGTDGVLHLRTSGISLSIPGHSGNMRTPCCFGGHGVVRGFGLGAYWSLMGKHAGHTRRFACALGHRRSAVLRPRRISRRGRPREDCSRNISR